jgi:hypothetical protein
MNLEPFNILTETGEKLLVIESHISLMATPAKLTNQVNISATGIFLCVDKSGKFRFQPIDHLIRFHPVQYDNNISASFAENEIN